MNTVRPSPSSLPRASLEKRVNRLRALRRMYARKLAEVDQELRELEALLKSA